MSDTTTVTYPAPTPNLNKALSLLQGEMPKVTKTKTGKIEGENKAGKFFSYEYSYADLGDVVADMGPLMAKHGLAFHCAPTRDPADRREMILAWSLLHESGEEKGGEWPLGPANQKPQSLGSAITYGRRYCFTAATNIVLEDDDDGQRAQQAHGNRQSAGDVFDNAAPVPPRQNSSNGGAPRPMNQGPRSAEDEAIDHDAQKFADEAHSAAGPREMQDIHRRAREGGKLAALVRNPAGDGNGKPGKLAVYLDWRRKQVNAACQLSPDDPWAAKVEELTSTADADTVLDEVARMTAAGELDAGHAGRIENAVIARFPDVGRESPVAA